MLKIGTLFSGGLGGIEFALKYENIPHQIAFACEWDKYARKQYLAFHGYPKGIYEHDVRFFLQKPFDILMPDYKDLDWLIWGSPCQDLSLAGQRKGFDGNKSVLFREGARITKEIMPKVIIFENVKGLLSSNNGNDFKEVLKTFRDMGYFITHKVLNAKNYGTAQNRERIFIVGFKDVEEYHKFNFEPGIKLEKCLKDYLDEVVDEKYYLKKPFEFYSKNSQSNVLMDINKECNTLMAGTHGYCNGYIIIDAILSTVSRRSSKEIYSINGICPILTRMQGGGQEPKILYNGFPRRLTPKECFRLMGVKDEDINIVVSDTQAYKCAGNGIEVNTIRSIVRSLYKPKKNIYSLF